VEAPDSGESWRRTPWPDGLSAGRAIGLGAGWAGNKSWAELGQGKTRRIERSAEKMRGKRQTWRFGLKEEMG
jgi:hypothetical protein